MESINIFLKKSVLHVSVTSFLCCLYFFPLIFSRRSCCIFPMAFALAGQWHCVLAKSCSDICPMWNWSPSAAKGQATVGLHLKALHAWWLNQCFLHSSKYFLLPLGLIFPFSPAVSFSLYFSEIGYINSSPHTWEDSAIICSFSFKIICTFDAIHFGWQHTGLNWNERCQE